MITIVATIAATRDGDSTLYDYFLTSRTSIGIFQRWELPAQWDLYNCIGIR